MTTPTTPPPARVLTFAQPHTTVPVRNVAGVIETFYVLGHCGFTDRRTCLCVPCGVTLANWGQLEMHVEQGGTHVFVTWCGKHGIAEGPTERDLERLERMQQLESGL